MTAPAREQAIQTLGERLNGISVAMLTTLEPDGSLLSRPMMAQTVPFDGDLWFVARAHSRLVWDIQRHPRVNLTYSQPGLNRFVSVTGTAHVVRDRAKAEELWNPNYQGWFEGLDDPELCLLRVSVEAAQAWGVVRGTERIDGFTARG
jgi:general stress protein 26